MAAFCVCHYAAPKCTPHGGCTMVHPYMGGAICVRIALRPHGGGLRLPLRRAQMHTAWRMHRGASLRGGAICVRIALRPHGGVLRAPPRRAQMHTAWRAPWCIPTWVGRFVCAPRCALMAAFRVFVGMHHGASAPIVSKYAAPKCTPHGGCTVVHPYMGGAICVRIALRPHGGVSRLCRDAPWCIRANRVQICRAQMHTAWRMHRGASLHGWGDLCAPAFAS